MIVTERDRKVIDFINKFNTATTKTIQELFYPSLRVAQNRLKLMTDNKILKRDRDHFTSQFHYYTDTKPRQVYHNLLLADFYKELNKVAGIKVFRKEFEIGNLRSDGLVGYRLNNTNYIAFVEVELSNKPDVKKYEDLYRSNIYKKHFGGVFPLIIYVTNKDIPDTKLKVVQIKEDMKDLKFLLKLD